MIRPDALKTVAAGILMAVLTGCAMTTSDPASTALPSRAQHDFGAAVAAMQAQQWQDAEVLLQPLAVAYPRAAGVNLNLGIVYFELGRVGDAEQVLRAAVAAAPANMDAANWLGRVLREQGRFDEAETVYSAALKRDPDHPATHRNLGILYDLYLGKPAEAQAHYLRYQALQGEPPDRQVAGWLADLERRL
ncbi:MAG: tetratricopeptide repeat protein [Spongiibacteraceae bacterium]|nr:tetratricopeptide repeat protein [Spongiibacteraceae bacterium]